MSSSNTAFGDILNGAFAVVLYTSEYFDGVKKVLERSFFPNEMTTIGTEIDNVNAIQARLDLIELCRDVGKDNISLVALDKTTGQVVGFVFNKIQSHDEDFYGDFIRQKCISDNAKSLIQFMIDVDSKFDLFGHYDTDCFFEIMFLAVLPEFERKSIGRKLCEQSIRLATDIYQVQHYALQLLPSHLKEKRPCVITSNMSSRHSQRIGELLGFETHFVFLYTDISFNGKTYAERINNPLHLSTTLVAKRL